MKEHGWVLVEGDGSRREWSSTTDREKVVYARRKDNVWWADVGRRGVRLGEPVPANSNLDNHDTKNKLISKFR